MSTQQDIYAAGSENRPPMLNKDNYVRWSSRIIRYAMSRPNRKMIVDSIKNGPYVRQMIATPGELDLLVLVLESFHEQTDEELIENDIKQMDADDQAIQTILLGLPEDIYDAVDSCETAKEIWERVRQMMKGLNIREQEKKAKLFNEWEKFTSKDGESIESYYHHFMQLMNDLKRKKHFPENILASSFYNGNFLLEEHDPPAVYDSEETLKLAQESREKLRFLKKEIKSANYANFNHLSGVFVPQMTKSKEELILSNVSNMVTISKTISIPNEDLLDDTTPSVARKFLNEVKNSLVALQRVVKKMTLEVHNWSSSAHKEEADESLDKQKFLELEIKRLLKASVSHDIMSIVQNGFVDVPSDLQTELDPQLRDLKGKSSDTPSTSNTLDPLNQKLESKIVELEFQVVNYEREISHLKTSYKNLFNSITSNQAHAKLHNLIYENAKLRARLFENTSKSMKCDSLGTSVTPHVDKPKLITVTPHYKKLRALIPSHSIPQPREFNVMKHRNVIAHRMFKSIHLKLLGLVHTARTRRPQPKGNSRNARVPSASKSSKVKKNNDKSKIVCGTCKQCLVTVNHDACLLSLVDALNSRANNLCTNASPSVNQKRHRIQVWKPKQVRFKERLASGSESRPPMLNKENYVPWSSRLLRYA
nr:hypothetical protein [Tanacetum cinerariifolium]